MAIKNFSESKLEYGKPSNHQDLTSFILGKVRNQEIIYEAVFEAAKAVETILESGIDSAMNQYNS